MDEVVAALRDSGRWSEIVECAYREVALNPRYTFRAMIQEFDEVAGAFMSALPRRSFPNYDEAGFAKASTILGARSRGWRVALGELGTFVERNLQASLVRLIAPVKNRRVRDALKRTYFAATDLAESSYAMAAELSSLLRTAQRAGSASALGHLWHLRVPLLRRLTLVRELNVLASVESLALDSDAFRLTVRTSPDDGVLWIEGHALGGRGASFDEAGGWDRVAEQASRGRLRRLCWRIRDEWSLAPRPRVPDEHEFPALSEALGAQPGIALALIRHALTRVVAASGGESRNPATTTHAA